VNGRPATLWSCFIGMVMASLLSVSWLQAHAQSPASGSGRPQVTLKCMSYGTGPMLECIVDLKRREGTPLDGAHMSLGALMPSMPMVHSIKPMKAAPTGVPGQYKATLELEMLGVWAVNIDIDGPVREKVSRNLVVHDCEANTRCAATAAQATDLAPMRHSGGHRH
jgi:hypothetical protein